MTQIVVEGLSVALFPHQLSSVYHLERREHTKNICTGVLDIHANMGLFSDLAGFGKTLTLVSLILRDRMSWNLEEPFTRSALSHEDPFGGVSARRNRMIPVDKCNATLIVVHQNIVGQWKDELARCSRLSVFVAAAKLELLNLEPDRVDVVLCGHGLYRELTILFPRVWKRVIYDDPVSADIPKMHPVDSGFIWFVSDASAFSNTFVRRTYRGQHFLKTLFVKMPSDVYQSLVVKNDDSYVGRSWTLLPPVHFEHPCGMSEHGLPRDDVPSSVRAGGGVVRLVPDLSKDTDACSICLKAPMTDPIFVRCCENRFGGVCLLRWLEESFTCPLCRKSLAGADLVALASESQRSNVPSRLEVVRQIVTRYPEGKFIIFCSNAKPIQSALRGLQIPLRQLQGNAVDSKTMALWTQGLVGVLCLSRKYSGAGLSLPQATDIILFRDVEARMERHLISRANRIGRPRASAALRVHHLKDACSN